MKIYKIMILICFSQIIVSKNFLVEMQKRKSNHIIDKKLSYKDKIALYRMNSVVRAVYKIILNIVNR